MNNWMQVKTNPQNEGPCPRWGHSMCTIYDDIYIFGGYENSKYYNDLWKFNLNTLKYTQVMQMGEIPPPCSNFTMNVDQKNSKILIFGGGTLNKQKLNSIYSMDILTHTWTKLPVNNDAPQPWQRSYHCSEIIGKYLVVTGGEFFHDLDDLWLYDLQKYQWMEVKIDDKNAKPKARKFSCSFQYKNKMYIVGGCYAKYQCLKDIYYIDFNKFLLTNNVQDIKWQQIKFSGSELINRWGHVATIKDDKAFIFGGRLSNKDLQNLVQIDLSALKCSEVVLKGSAPKGRRKPGLCMKNNTLLCLSGFDGSYVKDFLQINLMKKPNFTKELNQTQSQCQLQINESQTFNLVLDNNISISTTSQQINKRKDCLPAAPLTAKNVVSLASNSKYLHKVKYFQIIKSSAYLDQEFIIYRPENISNEEYNNLCDNFLLYLQHQKIFFNESIQEYDQQLNFLLELSDYYGIIHLKSIIKRWAFYNFQKKVRSKKIQFKTLIQRAYHLNQIDQQLGQYVGYCSLLKLIEGSHLNKIEDIKIKLNKFNQSKQTMWISAILEKYQFQLQQQAMNKVKSENQNQVPQFVEWTNQKTQINTKVNFNFFGIH